MNATDALLKGILATIGRTAFPVDVLYKIVAPTVGSAKQIQAYNLCDGETPQAEIGKKLKLDSGNFSRTVAKWVEVGVVIRVGQDGYPLHLYPLPPKPNKKVV